MKKIAVFCGSKVGTEPEYSQVAKLLGQELANRNIDIVYGGGGIGLMGVLADGALEAHGKVTGVIPEKLYEMEVAHMGLSELYRVKTMHERKALMADLSDGFIALPGGIGTLEELMEVLTWAQIGYHNKPCALLNVNGYYDNFISFFDQMEEKGFLYEPIQNQLIIESTVDGVLHRMLADKC
jgi:uncharacterized protein (TIGR00730 family)